MNAKLRKVALLIAAPFRRSKKKPSVDGFTAALEAEFEAYQPRGKSLRESTWLDWLKAALIVGGLWGIFALLNRLQ